MERGDPSLEELQNATSNLGKAGNKIDYIFTHEAPYVVREELVKTSPFGNVLHGDSLTNYLDYVYDNIEFRRWYCGHWHNDVRISGVDVLFLSVLELGE